MRIDFHLPAESLSEPERASSSPPHSNGESSPLAALTGDQAQLSATHAQVQALAAAASQLPDARSERVQTLRLAVDRGQYHPATGEVAGALVDHMFAQSVA